MPTISEFIFNLLNPDYSDLSTRPGDLIIVETGSDSQYGLTLTPAEVAELQDQGRTVIGYLNVAVTDHNRTYWEPDQGDDWVSEADPLNPDVGPLNPGAPDWLIHHHGYATDGGSETFGYIVDYTDDAWQARVIAEAVHMVTATAEGGLGYSGVFLDDVGRYFDAADNDPGYSFTQAARDMIDFVNAIARAIHAVAPDAYIAINGGAYIGWDSGEPTSADTMAFFDNVDALLLENQFGEAWNDVLSNDTHWDRGQDFLAIEHSGQSDPDSFAEWAYENGVVPYVVATDDYDDIPATTPPPAGEGDDILTGGDGPNLIDADDGDDEVSGLGGNDTIISGDGRDTVDGGSGHDVLQDNAQTGPDGADLFFGGAGRDSIFAGGGADTAHGQAGRDVIYGGRDADLLYGGIDFDFLHGGADDDTLFGGNGRDTVNGGNGNDELIDNGQGGDLGRDLFFGENGNDTVRGGGGNDTAHGGNGNDQLFGGVGNDEIYGGANYDFIHGNADDDVLHGGNGRDTVNGGNGNDEIIDNAQGGVHGADIFLGEAGNDTIRIGGGNDTATGGAGSDTFVFAAGHGNDVITDFDALDGDEDIDLRAITAIADIDQLLAAATQVGNDVRIDTGGGNSILLEGVTRADLDDSDFIFI